MYLEIFVLNSMLLKGVSFSPPPPRLYDVQEKSGKQYLTQWNFRYFFVI